MKGVPFSFDTSEQRMEASASTEGVVKAFAHELRFLVLRFRRTDTVLKQETVFLLLL